jgi:hypothetical protein
LSLGDEEGMEPRFRSAGEGLEASWAMRLMNPHWGKRTFPGQAVLGATGDWRGGRVKNSLVPGDGLGLSSATTTKGGY